MIESTTVNCQLNFDLCSKLDQKMIKELNETTITFENIKVLTLKSLEMLKKAKQLFSEKKLENKYIYDVFLCHNKNLRVVNNELGKNCEILQSNCEECSKEIDHWLLTQDLFDLGPPAVDEFTEKFNELRTKISEATFPLSQKLQEIWSNSKQSFEHMGEVISDNLKKSFSNMEEENFKKPVFLSQDMGGIAKSLNLTNQIGSNVRKTCHAFLENQTAMSKIFYLLPLNNN